MSYDFDDDRDTDIDRITLPPKRRGPVQWLGGKWFSFVLWCALDAPWTFVNEWGLRRLGAPK